MFRGEGQSLGVNFNESLKFTFSRLLSIAIYKIVTLLVEANMFFTCSLLLI